MPKKFRVISQAAPVAGKTKQDVHKALLKMSLKAEQIQLLLLKPLVIKKGLESATALEYAERFSAAGLKVRVEAYEVPAPQEISDEGKQRDQVYNTLLKAFTKPVEPAETHRGIGSAALLGALPAPLIYGGLILLSIFGLLWYLGVGHQLIFGSLSLPPAVSVLLWLSTWLVPALTGGGLLASLLYPFWPRPIPVPHLRLDPKRHARFHHLINQMTAAMDVAAPEFIEITPEACIRVIPVRGMRSLGTGDLRLTLGLAVVSNCTVGQLMGLIAREIGRFSTPSATRAAVWIYSVNGWFSRHASTGAEWDEHFQAWTEAYPARPARWGIELMKRLTVYVRHLLVRLTALNATTTRRTLLRLEQAADHYQVQLSGATEFANTATRVRALMAAERDMRQLNHLALYLRDQLLHDLPAAISEAAVSSRPGTQPQQDGGAYQENDWLWEPHAPDAAHIAQASGSRSAGLISSALPARILLDNFTQLCDSATLHAYHRQGIADADQLRVANAKVLNERETLFSQSRIDAIQQGARAPLNADGSVEWTGRS